MAGVRVRHNIHDLARDLAAIPPRAVKDIIGTLREGARVGGMLARENARRSSGKHGKHYPRSITWDRAIGGAFGVYTAEYGPDLAKPQGNMSFEYGSRNQKPHLDLARSADVTGAATARDIREKSEDWFWLGGER